MQWLNYHHLLYFWTVAREGSIARACERLRLAQPTISTQLRSLEESFGEKLFAKSGRGLVLTEAGRVVYGYADEIFTLGRELQDVLKGMPRNRPLRLNVGVADSIPKLIGWRILQPVLSMEQEIRLVCQEDSSERLLTELAEHRLDVIITDSPLPAGAGVRAYNHLLGSCEATLFAKPELAGRLKRGFPQSLNGEPFLLPAQGAPLRRALDQWLEDQGLQPRIVGEFKDSALMKTFGEAGAGVFCGPRAIVQQIRSHYRVAVIGSIAEITESYYAISAERRIPCSTLR